MTSRDEWDDAISLAVAHIEGAEEILAAARAAYRHGYAQGWQAGYERSFEKAPSGWSAGNVYTPVPDVWRTAPYSQPPSGETHEGDYQGGPVKPW